MSEIKEVVKMQCMDSGPLTMECCDEKANMLDAIQDVMEFKNVEIITVNKGYDDTHSTDTVKHITNAERISWNAKSEFSGDYPDLSNKPTIPINSDFTLSGLGEKSYNNLTDKPDLSLKADLVEGKVPGSQLPSYVDDVLEFANLEAFPSPSGENGKIYVALDTNKCYRWSGSAYVEISESLALGETSSTAYPGNKGKDAYDLRHDHSNKALLDTYTQTETNLADAVSKKHEHSNKTILDNTTAPYTTAEASKLSGVDPGAQVNVIEVIKDSDGNILTITDKTVILPASSDGATMVTAQWVSNAFILPSSGTEFLKMVAWAYGDKNTPLIALSATTNTHTFVNFDGDETSGMFTAFVRLSQNEYQFCSITFDGSLATSGTESHTTFTYKLDGVEAVSKGGTGRSTLTAGSALIGNGTSAVAFKAIDTTVTENSTNLITSGAVKAALASVDGVSLGETSETAYRGDRGKTAYDHSQLTSGNPHGVTKTDLSLGNVENYKQVRCTGNTASEIQNHTELTASQFFCLGIDAFSSGGDVGYKALSTLITTFIYPVGSIYMSVANVSPQTFFGGTWVALEDRFLLGAGSTYTAGATGGEATHTLTTGEIPSHTHTQDSHTHTQNSHEHSVVKSWAFDARVNESASPQILASSTNTSSGSGATTNKMGNISKASNTGAMQRISWDINQDSETVTATNQSTTATNQNTGGGGAHNNMPPYLVVYMWKRTA